MELHHASLIVLIMICFIQLQAEFRPSEAFDATFILWQDVYHFAILKTYCKKATKERCDYD